MKKHFLIIISLLLTLSLCGCGADTATESTAATTPAETAVATPASTPSPTPSPTVAPTPSPTIAASAVDLQEQFTDAPEIDGLTKAIQDDSVIYTYDDGNPYSGTAGDYAGVYKENVTVEGEKVGGVCLAPDICLVLLYEALAEIPEGEIKLKVVVPLDISNYDGKVEMSNLCNTVEGYGDCTYIKIYCPGSVPIVNIIPDVTFLNSGHGGNFRSVVNIVALENYSSESAYMNISIDTDGVEFPEREGFNNIFYGSELATKDPNSTMYLQVIAPEIVLLNSDSLLKVEDKPVFIITEES